MVDHLFFDLDNTLWDFRKNSCLALKDLFIEKEVEQNFGVSFTHFHTQYYTINEKLWLDLSQKKINKNFLTSQRFSQAFKSVGITDPNLPNYFKDNYLQRITKYNHLIDNSLDILKYLYPHYKLHILTNGFKDITGRKIKLSGIKKYFTTITSADELMIRKPEAKIYQYALNKAKTTSDKSAYIGDDWEADALGSKKLGFTAIFFNPLQEKLSHPNVKNISSLLELKNIF